MDVKLCFFVILIILGLTKLSVSQTPSASRRGGSGGSTGPSQSQKPCIKHPPNFREVDLPCGGYDKESCERVCKKLGHTKAYCKQEVFCLCNSGNLYSC